MAKKLLAIVLAMLMLASVMGLAASAAYEPVATDDTAMLTPLNAPSRSIVRRIERYVAIAESSGNAALLAEVQQIVQELDQLLIAAYLLDGANRIGANILASVAAITIASELRSADELSTGAYIWSMIRGHMWWLWVPIVGIVLVVAIPVGTIVLLNALG